MFTFDLSVLTNIFLFLLSFFQWILTVTGVIVIIRGGLSAAFVFIHQSLFKGGFSSDEQWNEIRRILGMGILIGLEFILAADVISTLLLPDYYHLGMLAILVFIRTVLNYFLGKELEGLKRVQS